MNYFNQALSLANMINCLCQLFANSEGYGPEIQAKIQQIESYLNDLQTELEAKLSQNGISFDTETHEDPCDQLAYIIRLMTLLDLNNIQPSDEGGESGGEGGEGGGQTDYYTSIFDLFGQIAASEENPCGELEPFDAKLKLNVPCVCRMLGLLGKLSGEVNDEIQELHNRFETLKTEVGNRSASLLPTELVWPEDTCEQVDLLAKLLAMISLRPDLADTQLIDAYDSFINQIGVVKDMLAEMGIYPCENEIELGSDKLYIQAAGSVESDGSVDGVHLRWSFMNDLAENHLPKGNLSASGTYQTSIGHNKPNDFIRLFKFPYTSETEAKICLDFNTLTFSDIDKTTSSTSVTWVIEHKINSGVEKVRLLFTDPGQYSAAATTPKDVIDNYLGEIEISIDNRKLFATEFHFDNASSAENKYEAISEYSYRGESDEIISTRISDVSGHPSQYVKRIVNETVKTVKLTRVGNSEIAMICLESYHAFYYKNMHLIDYMNQYALTYDPTDNSEAFDRLEDTSRFTVNEQWPSFNNGVTIKTQSYKDKWTESDGGLKHSVEKYLDLSKTDIRAMALLDSEDDEDESQFELSFIDALNIAATDYHFARMLGLGEIDETVEGTESFIYMAEYKLKLPGITDLMPLLYFTLPTSREDQRLPLTPALEPVQYGFTPQNDDSDSLIQINSQGYAAYGNLRFIRLNKEDYPYENPDTHTVEFDTGIITKAIRFGIEYRDDGQTFVKPEITSDPNSPYLNYDNSSGGDIAENDPVVEGDNALFVHTETTEGVHDYAIYGINWFNRVSDASPIQSTDETAFPPKESLLPPSKTQILLLQSDLTELLVLPTEWDNTNNEVGATFKNKLRVRFDWNHIHNINYSQANKVEFFHRVNPPLEIKGKITTVTPDANNEKFELQTTSYEVKSTYPIKNVVPTILTADRPAYIGGKLMIDGKVYTITAISGTESAPTIQVQGIEVVTKSFDQELPRKIILSKSYEGPKPNSFFSAIENLNNEANWNKLNKTINIVHFGASQYTETEVDEENQTRILTIGGIKDTATVTQQGPNPNSFLLTFGAGVSLADHPQKVSENVYWENGIARIILATNKIELKVTEIVDNSPLSIMVLNDSGVTLPSSVEVNYHPSYVVYIDKEPTNNFDDANLLPLSSEEERTTYFSLRSIDDTLTQTLKSDMANPIDLKTHKVYEALKPDDPLGADFATRPDSFGKSTYTFDTNVDTSVREPYGMMFLRANEDSILKALYQKSTFETIKNELEAIEPDAFHTNRFKDLANGILDGSGNFKTYEDYAFPEPDSSEYNPGLTGQAKVSEIQRLVNSAFVPLTKDPVIYSKIEIGYQTENTEPVLRNEKGKLLNNSDSDYYPYPMIRKYDEGGDWNVRFTDYTLDGAAENDYFYFTREIDLNYRFGPRSEVKGPIQLINSKPPVQPKVAGVVTLLADVQLSLNTRIEFSITPYKNDNIQKLRIYRTLNEARAGNVSLMDMVKEVDFNTSIFDDFSDLPFLPFGELIYYRIVALREITNEQGNTEYIPSIPSEKIENRLIDENNPTAPIITVTSVVTPSATTMDNVTLKWSKTVHNGTYYVFMLSNSGTWQKIHEISSNDETFELSLASTGLGSGSLDKTDEDGDIIYYRFKIDVENSSGLMNLNEEIVTFSHIEQASSGISFDGTEGMEIGSTFIVK
jgi:hypothetical protein